MRAYVLTTTGWSLSRDVTLAASRRTLFSSYTSAGFRPVTWSTVAVGVLFYAGRTTLVTRLIGLFNLFVSYPCFVDISGFTRLGRVKFRLYSAVGFQSPGYYALTVYIALVYTLVRAALAATTAGRPRRTTFSLLRKTAVFVTSAT